MRFSPASVPATIGEPKSRSITVKTDSEPRARTGRRRQHREAQSVESFALPEGAEVSVVRERSPEQVAAAARWIKKHMPGVARRGQKTAQEILRDIRGK